MPRAFDDLQDGTVLEPFHLNMIYRELRRLRKMYAVPPMIIDGIESADSPPIFRVSESVSTIVRGKVTTAIPTGTITSPSSTGRVTLYDWNGTTSSAGETGVTVLNDHTLTASIAVNAVVKLAWIDGDYWVVAADCP